MTGKKRVLVVVTNVSKYPTASKPTGLWLCEATHFVKQLEGQYEIDYVSPQGGYTPMDPASLTLEDETDVSYYTNHAFLGKLGATLKPSDVNAADYIAIYYTGGHGTVWDFPDNSALQGISRDIYEAGGYVCSVCHGAVALLNIKLASGVSLIAGKRVTGFSNDEEKGIKLDHLVPFLTESELAARGGLYQKADAPWAAFAVSDARVITGQNPASGGKVAELLLSELKAAGH